MINGKVVPTKAVIAPLAKERDSDVQYEKKKDSGRRNQTQQIPMPFKKRTGFQVVRPSSDAPGRILARRFHFLRSAARRIASSLGVPRGQQPGGFG